jgi:hypothetical protein
MSGERFGPVSPLNLFAVLVDGNEVGIARQPYPPGSELPHPPDARPADSTDDSLPLDDLDDEFVLAQIVRIMAEARRRAAAGSKPVDRRTH